MWNVLIPLFPFVRRERDTEEEASVLIDTTHHHLSVFTSFQGFDGERIAVKGLIARTKILKVAGKQKTACLTNQMVCKNKQRPKFKLVSLLFRTFGSLCVCVLLEPAVSSTLWQRGREEGPGGGWGQQQSASPPVSTAFDMMWCEKRAAPNVFINLDGKMNPPTERCHYTAQIIKWERVKIQLSLRGDFSPLAS